MNEINVEQFLKSFTSKSFDQLADRQKMFLDAMDYILNKLKADKFSMDLFSTKEGRRYFTLFKALTFPHHKIDDRLIDVVNRVYSDMKNGRVPHFEDKVDEDNPCNKNREHSIYFPKKYLPVIIPISIYGRQFYILYTYSFAIKNRYVDDDDWIPKGYVLYKGDGLYYATSIKGLNPRHAVSKALNWYKKIMKGEPWDFSIKSIDADSIKDCRVSNTVAFSIDEIKRYRIREKLSAMEIDDSAVDIIAYKYVLGTEGLPFGGEVRATSSYFVQSRVEDAIAGNQIYRIVREPLSIEEEKSILNMEYGKEEFSEFRLKNYIAPPELLYKFVIHYAHLKNSAFLLPFMLNEKEDSLFFNYVRWLTKDNGSIDDLIKKVVKVQLQFAEKEYLNFASSLKRQADIAEER